MGRIERSRLTRQVAPNTGGAHVLYAFTVLLAVALAVLLAWMVGGDDSSIGEEEKCFNVLERVDTSPCNRVFVGVRANVVFQLSLAAVLAVTVTRRRQRVAQALLILDASVLGCAAAYIFIRSWDIFGAG